MKLPQEVESSFMWKRHTRSLRAGENRFNLEAQALEQVLLLLAETGGADYG